MNIFDKTSYRMDYLLKYLNLTWKITRKNRFHNKYRYVPNYISESFQFEKMGGVISKYFPILNEKHAQAGAANGHYFHQDLLVAQFIYKSNPMRHIDVGSRIDGFVAHVASYRPIEVFDVRKLNPVGHQNISFLQANIMDSGSVDEQCADSISCLHAIEHFGLGRYGDPLDPQGHIKGFQNLLRMLKPNGMLYISFPIGTTNEVHFNAHRIFNPLDILSWPTPQCKLQLERFDYVDDQGDLYQNQNPNNTDILPEYGCGIYSLRKLPQ